MSIEKCKECKKYGQENCLSLKVGRGLVSVDNAPLMNILAEKKCFEQK